MTEPGTPEVQCLTCAHFSSTPGPLGRLGFGRCVGLHQLHGGINESAVFVRNCAAHRLAEDAEKRATWGRKRGFDVIPFPPTSAPTLTRS